MRLFRRCLVFPAGYLMVKAVIYLSGKPYSVSDTLGVVSGGITASIIFALLLMPIVYFIDEIRSRK